MTLQWQLVTECWIEPQQGFSVGCEPGFKYLENKDYKDIAASVSVVFFFFFFRLKVLLRTSNKTCIHLRLISHPAISFWKSLVTFLSPTCVSHLFPTVLIFCSITRFGCLTFSLNLVLSSFVVCFMTPFSCWHGLLFYCLFSNLSTSALLAIEHTILLLCAYLWEQNKHPHTHDFAFVERD